MGTSFMADEAGEKSEFQSIPIHIHSLPYTSWQSANLDSLIHESIAHFSMGEERKLQI